MKPRPGARGKGGRYRSGAVDGPPSRAVELEDRDGLLAEHPADGSQAPALEVRPALGEDRPLIEADLGGVLLGGAAHQAADAAPKRGAETHGARLAGGHQLVRVV